jgi:hypothetical protein
MMVALSCALEVNFPPFVPEPTLGLLPNAVPKKLEFVLTLLLWPLAFNLGTPEPDAVFTGAFVLRGDSSSSLETSFRTRGLPSLLLLYLPDPPNNSALESDMNVLQVSVMQDDVSRTMSAFVTLAGEEFSGATGSLSR